MTTPFRIGILFDCRKTRKFNVLVNIRMATLVFDQAYHTNGHPPAEARFNPAQLPPAPESKEIFDATDLRIITDRRVPFDHIRITTALIKEDEEAAISLPA